MNQPRPMSAAEFFEWEARQHDRFELIDGIAFAMAGASDAHGTSAIP
ncbi:MAG: hypothetical protein GIX03_09595 [Candidatus Eremiobacteraeota bacterium]|nr:hypothetical protein [Candidatus Eremiobacteraeota bacterium]MBC5803223.1 hypothetical protein [Candidatus Eremiobacteraeota bacterium]MBC5823011.1 hypothetical protein [Candidatus Eremiobacteraeota bacterium]